MPFLGARAQTEVTSSKLKAAAQATLAIDGPQSQLGKRLQNPEGLQQGVRLQTSPSCFHDLT